MSATATAATTTSTTSTCPACGAETEAAGWTADGEQWFECHLNSRVVWTVEQ